MNEKKKVQETVMMGVVVRSDGTVGDVDVTRSLEPSFDEAAVTAAKQWLFTPGEKNGKPVAVRVTIEMTFTRK